MSSRVIQNRQKAGEEGVGRLQGFGKYFGNQATPTLSTDRGRKMIAPTRPASAANTMCSDRATKFSVTRPSSGAGVPRPATASLLARRNTSACSKSLPGAHKPKRADPPSNDAILKETACNSPATSGPVRPRTSWSAVRGGDRNGGDLLGIGHIHGEIVDDTILRELNSISSKKDKVCWSNSVPPSPVATEHILLTPPTVKRGVNIKGVVDSCGDETPLYGTSPRCGKYGGTNGDDTHAYPASPSHCSTPSTNNVTFLATHTRPTGPLMWPDINQQKAAEAEKRLLYKEELDLQISAQKALRPSTAVTARSNKGSEFATPHKLVNERQKWEDTSSVYENDTAIMQPDSARKREAQQRYKAELDFQLQEKRAQTAAAGRKAAGVWVSKQLHEHDLSVSVSQGEISGMSPMNDARLMTPQSDHSAASHARYGSVVLSPQSAPAAGAHALNGSVHTKTSGGRNADILMTPVQLQRDELLPELKATASKIATMHWGERDIEAWREKELKRLNYRADLLAQIEAKKSCTKSPQSQQVSSSSASGAESANAAEVVRSEDDSPSVSDCTFKDADSNSEIHRLGRELQAAPIVHAHRNRQVNGNVRGEEGDLGLNAAEVQQLVSSGVAGRDETVSYCSSHSLFGMPHQEAGMTDFGLTREPEAWERPKAAAHSRSPRSEEDPHMPEYIARYLGGAGAGTPSVGIERADEDLTPRYEGDSILSGGGAGGGRGWRSDVSDTASGYTGYTQLTGGGSSSSARLSTRPKIAFGRRVDGQV